MNAPIGVRGWFYASFCPSPASKSPTHNPNDKGRAAVSPLRSFRAFANANEK